MLDQVAPAIEARGRASKGRTLGIGLALLSAAAAEIHFAVVGEHLREFWLAGVFFAILGVLQAAWAVGVMVRPSRTLLLAGAVANALVVLLWIQSRTIGIPLGPEAWTPEPVGFADLLSSAYEALIVIGACVALARGGSVFQRAHAWAAGVATLTLFVIPLTALSLVGLGGMG